jgi:hypothetical protein
MATTAASLTNSNFEIDSNANLKVDGTSPAIDWLNSGANTFRTGVVVKQDLGSGSGDNSFGQGSKEDTAVPSVVSGSIPPNKSDLKFFGVYTESNANGDFLNLFWSRVQDPSGTTNMDFEFNHNKCDADDTAGNVCSSNGVTPVRTEGDLLIQYDLSNGGTVATITKREWTGSAWGPATGLGTDAIGTINTTSIPSGEAGTIGAHSPRTFGEASINLASLFAQGECDAFGSAYLKSRSSDTFSSALKDFIAPKGVNITNCGSITIVKDATPNSAQDFAFTTTGTGLSGFSLDDDANNTLPSSKTFNNLNPGEYKVAETAVNGWTLTGIDCGTASHSVTGNEVTITLAAKQNVTCTFSNQQDLYDILVLTCTADGELVASSLDLDDGTAVDSRTDADTELGVSESDICDLADFTGVTGGPHDVDVDVDNPGP